MKMKCTKARNLMSPYLDRELDGAGREKLETHLGACGECRAAYAAMEQVHGIFAQAERAAAPFGFSTRVTALARSSERSPASLFPFAMKLAAEAIAVAAVVALGVLSGSVLVGAPSSGGAASPTAMLSLEIFDAAPPDSPGGVYLAMTEVGHD
jgi:anti-sigma factor RsiW